MDHSEFRERYEAERETYDRWGAYVTEKVISGVRERLGPTADQHFFKVHPVHRTKAVDGLVEKGYYRGKQYVNPYDEITDKVGTRFVVLLLEHVNLVKEVIVACPDWTHSKDRDFEEERERHPMLFDYQSVHFVVRCANGVGGFPQGFPCEIQVRTLMQHAFSELTHDTVYKPQVSASAEVLRAVAKSIALIETTDAIFQSVSSDLRMATRDADQWVAALETMYMTAVGQPASTIPRPNVFLLSALQSEWKDLTPTAVQEFLYKYPEIGNLIRGRFAEQFLFRQPVILLVYFLVDRARVNVSQQWPYTFEELAPVYSDLGYSLTGE